MHFFAWLCTTFAKWFVFTFFAWLLKQGFDAVVSPWMERPLTFLRATSNRVATKFRQEVTQIREAYSDTVEVAAV